MKYELTREQLQEILEIGCGSVDVTHATSKLNKFLEEVDKAVKIRETNDPQKGEVFLFKGLKYKCLPPESQGSECETCNGCDFNPTCDAVDSSVKDSPMCVSPHRIFKLIKEDENRNQ